MIILYLLFCKYYLYWVNCFAKSLTNSQLNEIKLIHVSEEENIPTNLKRYISSITDNYKLEENNIINYLENNCNDFQISKCIECKSLIDFTKDIPNIFEYAKTKTHDYLINAIWKAYHQRKLLNTIFDKYYKSLNTPSELNMIHRRHCHILDIYKSVLQVENNYINTQNRCIEITENNFQYNLVKVQ